MISFDPSPFQKMEKLYEGKKEIIKKELSLGQFSVAFGQKLIRFRLKSKKPQSSQLLEVIGIKWLLESQ